MLAYLPACPPVHPRKRERRPGKGCTRLHLQEGGAESGVENRSLSTLMALKISLQRGVIGRKLAFGNLTACKTVEAAAAVTMAPLSAAISCEVR